MSIFLILLFNIEVLREIIMENNVNVIQQEFDTMNTFKKFIDQILEFAYNANDVIDETEDEAIDYICKIIDRAEKALDEKEYLK